MTDANLRKGPWTPRVLLTMAVLVAVAFSAGFLWQFVEARSARAERDDLRQELTIQEMATQLASAVILADAGDYENARVLMSGFFTSLQDNVESAPAGATQDLQGILARRDAVITALSRSDPEIEQTLTQLFTRYQSVTGGAVTAVPVSTPRSSDSLTGAAGAAGAPGAEVGDTGSIGTGGG